jgi:hypothetical protein
MLLSDLPWLWCGPVPAGAPGAAQHVAVDPAELGPALAGLLSGSAVPGVAVVPPGVRPWSTAAALSPGPAVLRAAAAGAAGASSGGRAILWPAVNDLTGGPAAGTGLWLFPAALAPERRAAAAAGIAAGGAPVTGNAVPVTPPLYTATWDCGASPETAFRAGHAAMAAPADEDRGLTASLGADRPHGLWWGIGAATALLGLAADPAWAAEAPTPGRPSDRVAARRHELARQVRLRCGIEMRPLDPAQAAALRAMRSPIPPAALWDRHAADLAAVARADDADDGADDGATEDRGHRSAADPDVTTEAGWHRFARTILWGGPDAAAPG